MRIERDSMGEVGVPANALYGASTRRAVVNFPVSGHPMPEGFIRGLGLVKLACAIANEELGRLDPVKSGLIQQAAREVADGKLSVHFPVDVFQTGSGTSTNMNANEVIANRASQLTGHSVGSKRPLHPNDDVNLGQSSNDVIPAVLHVSLALALNEKLHPVLVRLQEALTKKSRQFSNVVKVGRTHLMDATPITLGQEFSGYAAQVEKAVGRAERAAWALRELAIGGTAVGTGINGHPGFSKAVCRILTEKTGVTFVEARNHFEAQGGRDDAVEVAGHLITIAGSLSKIANDLRIMGSGPRCGIGEIGLPQNQPGSSIMPGKANPVMCEMLIQVCLYTDGLCQCVSAAGREGYLELNSAIPLIAYSLHESIRCLSNAVRLFTENCVCRIEAHEERCRELVDRSLMLVTALTPLIGYDKAAEVAREASATGKTLREVVLEKQLVDPEILDAALNPQRMTQEPAEHAEAFL